MRASVVVVTYNSASDLPSCLDALLPTLGPDDEAIVFDCASSDDSLRIAHGFGVTTIAGENLGYGGGNNAAARAARGHWLVFLNPDTAVEPGWLDRLLAPLANGPGLATPEVVLMGDPGRIDTAANSVHLSGITVCRGFGQPAGAYAGTERVLAVSSAAFAIDRASFFQLGGFDERFFMYLEDTDLSLRAALAGLPCWYVGASRVRHRHVPNFTPRKLFWLERNRYLMLANIWRPRTLLLLAPTLLLIELMTLAYALFRGPEALRSKARAYGWVLANPWRLIARHKEAQRQRAVSDAALLAGCGWRIDFRELVGDGPLRILAELAAAPLLALCVLPLRLAEGEAPVQVDVGRRGPRPGEPGRARAAAPP